MDSASSKFLMAFRASRDVYLSENCTLLMDHSSDPLLSPALEVLLGKLAAESNLDSVAAWFASASKSGATSGGDPEETLELLWTKCRTFRHLVTRIVETRQEIRPTCLASLCSSFCDAVMHTAPDFSALTHKDVLDFPLLKPSPPMSLHDIAETVSSEGIVNRWRSHFVPDWMQQKSWPAHRLPVPATPSELPPLTPLWQLLCFETLKSVDILLKYCVGAVRNEPGDLLRLLVLLCGVPQSCMPWSHTTCSILADGIAFDLISLQNKHWAAGGLLGDVLWFRQFVKMCSVTQEVLGHALPLLLPLCDEHKPILQWIGFSALNILLRCCVSVDLHPYGTLLLESVHRGLASTEPALLSLLYPLQVYLIHAIHGNPPHDSYDKLYEDLLHRMGLQTKPSAQVVFFSATSVLICNMGVHFARHLRTFLDACEVAVEKGYSAPVCLAALHALLCATVSCWPVLRIPSCKDRLSKIVQGAHDRVNDLLPPGGDGTVDSDTGVLWTANIPTICKDLISFLNEFTVPEAGT